MVFSPAIGIRTRPHSPARRESFTAGRLSSSATGKPIPIAGPWARSHSRAWRSPRSVLTLRWCWGNGISNARRDRPAVFSVWFSGASPADGGSSRITPALFLRACRDRSIVARSTRIPADEPQLRTPPGRFVPASASPHQKKFHAADFLSRRLSGIMLPRMNTDTAQRLPFSRTVALLILLGLSLLIYVGNAAHPALLDDADGGHAVASQEMVRTGDWAVLHINGIRWMEKPPLHYWAVAASYLLLGESAFSTRLPLALAVAGLVVMIYVFGRRFFGDRAGFYAGLVMCTSIGTYMFTRIMIPEAIYALEFTAAFYLFLLAWTGTIS